MDGGAFLVYFCACEPRGCVRAIEGASERRSRKDNEPKPSSLAFFPAAHKLLTELFPDRYSRHGKKEEPLLLSLFDAAAAVVIQQQPQRKTTQGSFNETSQ